MSKFRGKIMELYDEGAFAIGRDEIVINLINWLTEKDAKEFWEHYYEEETE
jgi:hypothetical protein